MLSTPTAKVLAIHFYWIKRIHRVSYQIYKAKLNNELTPSRKKKQFFSYYIIFPLSSKLSELRPWSQNYIYIYIYKIYIIYIIYIKNIIYIIYIIYIICCSVKHERRFYQISNEVNKLMKIKGIGSAFVFTLIFHYLIRNLWIVS